MPYNDIIIAQIEKKVNRDMGDEGYAIFAPLAGDEGYAILASLGCEPAWGFDSRSLRSHKINAQT